MMDIFLNAVKWISHNRFWLGPVVCVLIWIGALWAITDVFKAAAKEMREM